MPCSTPISRSEDDVTFMELRDDATLLQAIAQHRDKDAFAELYARYETRAFNLASRILRNPALVQDAVQDAMLALWVSKKSTDLWSAEYWIMKVVLTHTLKLRRKQWRAANRDLRAGAEKSSEGSIAPDEPEQNELVKLLRERIDQLPELESTLLACSFGANLPHRQIAKLVNMPHRTVTHKIQQVLQQLRSDLAKAGIAAVVPALNAGLFEALTSGQACPPGTIHQMMGRIAEHESAGHAGTPSRDGIGRPRLGRVFAISALATVGVLGGALLWWPASKPATGPAPITIPATADSRIRKVRQWNFNTPESTTGIVLSDGNWHYRRDGGSGNSGCMESDGTALAMRLDLSEFKLPVRLTFVAQNLFEQPNSTFSINAGWTAHKGVAVFHNIGTSSTTKNAMTATVFISQRAIDVWLENRRVNLLATERKSDQLILALFGSRFLLDDLKIEEVDSSDIPDSSSQLKALDKAAPVWPAQSIELPDLTSAQPGKPVRIQFYPPEDVASKP